jgi:hypothetical protein
VFGDRDKTHRGAALGYTGFFRSDIAYDPSVLESPHSGGRDRAAHPECLTSMHTVIPRATNTVAFPVIKRS